MLTVNLDCKLVSSPAHAAVVQFISGYARSGLGQAVADPGIFKGSNQNQPKVEISMTICPQSS